jgi:hypothetical protein
MKITKRQLKRIIKEEYSKIIKESSDWYDDKHETLADKKYSDALDAEEQLSQEDVDLYFDEISDELEDMGSAVAMRDVAEMWLDENDRYYRGVYIDTRPIAGDKVKIVWPGWDEANYGGHLG